MPELVDVEGLRAFFEDHALHQTVRGVHVPDRRVLVDATPQSLGRRLKGGAFRRTRRHGKYLFAGIGEDDGWLLLHFGMTGNLHVLTPDGEAPAHLAMRVDFDGSGLGYSCQRVLGRVSWVADVEAFVEAEGLGPDGLGDVLDRDRFIDLFDGRRGLLRAALMNQAILAGIGNVLADEIMWQSRLPPKVQASALDREALGEVYRDRKSVV